MGRVNLRAKAKSVVSAAKNKAQAIQSELNKEKRQSDLLHKTLTPKKTTSKKEKSLQKHKKLLNRFAQQRKERKEAVARQNREKTAVIGDLHPLRDALPSLDGLYRMALDKRSLKTGLQQVLDEVPEKLSAKQKIKKKKQEFAQRVKSFEKIIKDKKFKEHPREVVAAHISNKYAMLENEP